MDDLISVIIPVYNDEQHIKRCIDSVRAQTYSNLEIILVDDGSTDDSGRICDEYAARDTRIKVLHQENGGLSRARNAGLGCVSGKYVGYVDSDDWIERDMYSYLLKLLTENRADVAVCDYIRTGKVCTIERQKEKIEIRSGKELDELFYRVNGGKSFFSVWNRLYKKELIQELRFLDDFINEDVPYTYEVYKKADRIVFSNLKKYFYFINKKGITGSPLCRKDFSQLKIWDMIVEQEKTTSNYPYAVLNRKRAVFNLYLKAKTCGVTEEIDKAVIQGWKKELKDNYDELRQGKFLDWKRKIVLFLICRIPLL